MIRTLTNETKKIKNIKGYKSKHKKGSEFSLCVPMFVLAKIIGGI